MRPTARRTIRSRRIAVAAGAILVATIVATNMPNVAGSHPSAGARPAAPFSHAGTYGVGTSSLDILEPGSSPGSGASRALPTAVWYPARPAGGHARAGRPPDRTHAPYPLLVFSQGYDISVKAYSVLLADWASAGFVVVAPTYPHTSPSDPAALDEGDILNHPADLRYVITAILRIAGKPGSVLSGLVDPEAIGAIGHSDGGDVTLAVAANSCCRDRRVKAAVILSGAELVSFGGEYFSGTSVPLLVSQGSADSVNLRACSAQIYDGATSPKYYLDFRGAGHEGPYLEPGPDRAVVARTTIEFLDGTLRGEAGALEALKRGGNVGTRATLSHGASAPGPALGCPGAPA